MGENYYLFGIFFIVMAVMSLLFIGVIGMIIRYLTSVNELITQVKNQEPELWMQLGRPEPGFIAPMHKSHNPFKEFLSQLKFFCWFLKGGSGLNEVPSIDLIKKTKGLFKTSMVCLAIYVIIFIVIIIFIELILENA